MKKFIVFLLVVLTFLTVLPMSAYAATDNTNDDTNVIVDYNDGLQTETQNRTKSTKNMLRADGTLLLLIGWHTHTAIICKISGDAT